jgi:hypothetical protein
MINRSAIPKFLFNVLKLFDMHSVFVCVDRGSAAGFFSYQGGRGEKIMGDISVAGSMALFL